MHVPNPIPPASSHSPYMIGSMSISPILMATMIYLFIIQQSSNPGPTAQHTKQQASQHWSNPHLWQAHVTKSWKSCARWTMAIIQQLWNTAWDLITHWNVESPLLGSGLPIIRWTAHPYPPSLHRTPFLLMALVSTVIWQIPQFSNPICYHRILSGRE